MNGDPRPAARVRWHLADPAAPYPWNQVETADRPRPVFAVGPDSGPERVMFAAVREDAATADGRETVRWATVESYFRTDDGRWQASNVIFPFEVPTLVACL